MYSLGYNIMRLFYPPFIIVLLVCSQRLLSQPDTSSSDEYLALGKKYFKQAQYDSALSVLTLALEIYEQQENKPGQIECMLQKGRIWAETGKTAEAEEIMLQVKKLADAWVEDTSLLYAEVLETTGEVYFHQQLFVQAAENLDRALAQKKDLLGKVHAEIAEIYRKKSLVAFAMNELQEAFRLVEENRKILAQLPAADTTLWADYYLALGSFYDRIGKSGEAQINYERSLKINLKVRGEMHPQTGRAYLNLSNILRIRENPLHARAYAEKALHIFEQAYGKRHIMVGSVNNSLAILDADLGDLAKAIVYYQNAIDIISEKMGVESIQTAYLLNNLGIAYGNSKQPGKALELLERSLEIRRKYFPENSVPIAVVFLNIGDQYKDMHQLDEALDYNQKAVLTFEQAGYAIGLATGYRGIAEVYFAQENFAEALTFFRKSAQLYTEISGENYVDLGQNYNQMAETFNALSQTDSALFYYQTALKVLVPEFDPADESGTSASFEHTNSWQHTITAMGGKAQTFWRLYQSDPATKSEYLQLAFDTYTIVAELIDLARNSYRQDASRLYLSEFVKPLYQNAIEVAYQLYQQKHHRTYLEAAFAFSEKSKYALLSDLMRESVVKMSAGIPDSVLQQEEAVKNEVALLEQTLLDARHNLNADTIQVLENSLTDAKKRHLDFIARLEQQYPDYFSLIYNTQVATIDAIQHQLLEKNILLEYALTNESVYLFVIGQDTEHFLRFNKAADLDESILSVRSAILEKDYQKYVGTAHTLYQQLIQQAEDEMGEAKKIIVVPDGMLALLPFEILLTDRAVSTSEDYSALSYILRKYQICYNYSATVALATKAKKSSNGARIEVLGFAPDFANVGSQPLMAANAAYEDTTREALVPLEGAEAELNTLSGLFKGRYFFRQEATEENFKRMATHSRIIHLATHAVVDDTDPMYSRLYFTPTDTFGEDGILHTYELYNLKLNAALVTLSACNTGLGKIQQGEGLVSLASGFAYAGCPNIVMSLWPASDKATARLMEFFYQGLSNGLPKDEALQKAKLQYLAAADELSANPYFWGSFVFMGEPSPLKSTLPVRGVVAIMAGSILVISGLIYFLRNRKKPLSVKGK